MDLIDWLGVARNALWILGLSIVLAAWSHLRWWAMSRQIKLRRAWEWPRFQAPFSAGLILFCISLAWSAARWWERGLWIALGAAFIWQLVIAWRLAARYGWDVSPDEPAAPPAPAEAAPTANDDAAVNQRSSPS
jgi:hypothetical protein